jgi:predicted nucleotidyltransferase
MLDKSFTDKLKDALTSALGSRCAGLVIYGSEAQRKALPDSDIDILVLIHGSVNTGNDLETIITATYPMQLEIGRQLHFAPVSYQSYKAGAFALYRNAQKEGIQV